MKKCYYTSYQVLIEWNGDIFVSARLAKKNTNGKYDAKIIFEIGTAQFKQNTEETFKW